MFNQWVRGWAPSIVTGEAYQSVTQSRFTCICSRQAAYNQSTAVPLNRYASSKTEGPALVNTPHMQNTNKASFLTGTKSLLMRLQLSTDTSILKYTLQPPAATAFPVSAFLFATSATLSQLEEQKRQLNTAASHNSQDRIPPNILCLPLHRDIVYRNSQG